MRSDLAGLVERTLHVVRSECPAAWNELRSVSRDLRVSLRLDRETFAVFGDEHGLRITRAPMIGGVRVEGSLEALRRVVTGERGLLDSVLGNELFVAGPYRDLVRTERAAQLLVAGAARSPSAAPLFDELSSYSPRTTKGGSVSERSQEHRKEQPLERTTIHCDVAVFGAGIAGLTAAHELAARNFTVAVIDPEIRPEPARPGAPYENPGLGGMAKSQWGFIPVGKGGAPRRPVPAQPMQATYPRPRWSAIEIGYERVDGALVLGPAVEDFYRRTDRGTLAEELEALEICVRELREHGYPDLTFAIVAPAEDMEAVTAELKRAREGLFAFAPLRSYVTDTTPTVTLTLNHFALPGEHGFRFFPSFYRHVFDTLKRIPLSAPWGSGETAPRGTVYDNLVPAEEIGYVGRAKSRSIRVPRRPITSMDEARKLVEDMLTEAEYTESDLAMLGATFLKYLTSSRLRREREYENLSWYELVEGDRFSPRARFLHETAPGTLGGLFGSSADARTQGTIAAQLMKDQLAAGSRTETDMLLNGPTDVAWFSHWHRYLRMQNVTFHRGTLEQLRPDGKPVVHVEEDGEKYEVDFEADDDAVEGRTRFIVALPLKEAATKARELIASVDAPWSEARDFAMLDDFVGDVDLDAELKLASPRGPLRHLSGVQYFFDQELRLWRGHTQYLDAPFGLTAIAQPQFWRHPTDLTSGYRSVLSVDIGIWSPPKATSAGAPPQTDFAWRRSPRYLAEAVWAQIKDQHKGDFPNAWPQLPEPYAYHVDENLVLAEGKISDNRSPFLVNEKGRFRKRPGSDGTLGDDDRVEIAYHVAFDSYVMAGTHMQTATRINSMEAACESGRRAVNALLAHLQIFSEPCQVWDPEDHEIAELEPLKALDRDLCKRDCPHMLDILRA